MSARAYVVNLELAHAPPVERSGDVRLANLSSESVEPFQTHRHLEIDLNSSFSNQNAILNLISVSFFGSFNRSNLDYSIYFGFFHSMFVLLFQNIQF